MKKGLDGGEEGGEVGGPVGRCGEGGPTRARGGSGREREGPPSLLRIQNGRGLVGLTTTQGEIEGSSSSLLQVEFGLAAGESVYIEERPAKKPRLETTRAQFWSGRRWIMNEKYIINPGS